MTKYATIAAYVAAWTFGAMALLFVACTLGGSFIEMRLWTPLENQGVRVCIVIAALMAGPFGFVHGGMKADPA